MKTPGASRASCIDAGLTDDPRWRLVQRIANSPQFHKSARLRDFLTYVAAEALQGRAGDLNEQSIGCAVFNRAPDYSPADDNIVRVNARQLRSRLEEYFSLEGRDEPLTILMPKGNYIPLFRERVAASATVPERVVLTTVTEMPAPLSPPPTVSWWRISPRLSVGICAGLLLLCAVLAFQNRRLRLAASGPAPGTQPWLLASVMDSTETTTVVIPDSGYGTLRTMLGTRPPLADYLEPGYPNGLITPGLLPAEERWIRRVTERPYTTFPSVVVATRLAQLAERNHWKVSFRFARDLTSRELNDGRFILIGSAIVNPWVSVFDSQLNFRSDWDPHALRSLFHNIAPKPWEQATYMPRDQNGVPGESFGAVSLLVNHREGQREGTTVLLIQGSNIESTEAAADFVFDTKMSFDGSQAAGAAPPIPGAAHYRFEALLRTDAVSGAARDTEVAATRYSVIEQ